MMGVTPVHPNLELDRPMTLGELIDAVRYEGLFGFAPRELAVVRKAESLGLVEINAVKDQPVVVNLMDDPS